MGGRVIIFGSINMDLVAGVDRIVRPGETVTGLSYENHPGGKGGNQALAAHLAGGHVVFLGKVGHDAFGQQMLDFYVGHGLSTTRISNSKDKPTGTALIQVEHDSGENAIVVIPGANHDFADHDVDQVELEHGDVVVAQFEVPLQQIEALFRRARAIGAVTMLNPAPMTSCSHRLIDLVDVLIVNETELAALTGLNVAENSSLTQLVTAARSARREPAQTVVVTLGAKGLVALVEDDTVHVPGRDVHPVDTTGAGDCFVGCLAQGLSAGMPLPAALSRATDAASLSVTRHGAASSLPTAEQIDAVSNKGG